MKLLYIISITSLLISCNYGNTPLSQAEQNIYLKIGDSISTKTQKILLSNVSEKIKESGVAHAVSYCNENAITLTNTFTDKTFRIQRLSQKNRNPQNNIATETDQKAWQEITTMNNIPPDKKHLILQNEKEIIYYKAIPLGMPTCLLCHGKPETNITSEVQQIISLKYPEDKATGYQMGELRGLWKITFQQDKL